VVALIGGVIALVAAVVVTRFGVTAAVHGLLRGGRAHVTGASTPRLSGVPIGSPLCRPDVPSEKTPDPRALTDEERGSAEDCGHVWLAGAAFWSAVVVAGVVALVVVSTPTDVAITRYLVPAWVAICVLGPALADRHGTRWIATVVASVVCLASTTLFHLDPATRFPGTPTVQAARDLHTFAEEFGVTRGFGAYWVATPVTRYTDFGLTLYPVERCPQAPETNCPLYLHTISSWYEPSPIDGPTMLVADPNLGPPVALDARYGEPIASRVIGGYTALIYSHDIARNLNHR